MAKLIIEIDTGTVNKVDRMTPGTSKIEEVVKLVQEAASRLRRMGANANGVVLYGIGGPQGRVTLVESERREGKGRNWYDDTVGAGVPLKGPRANVPADVRIFKLGAENICGDWCWENTRTKTMSGPFTSAQEAIDHSINHE